MLIRVSSLCIFAVFLAVFVQETKAFSLCEIFHTCPTSTAPVEPSGTPTSKPMPSQTSIVPSSSIISSSALPSSSVVSSIKPSSSSIVSSATPTSISSIASSTASLTSTSSSLSSMTTSALPSETSPAATTQDGGSNVGVIVGSVCGFIAIIGAGFAYAFFSKTRRNNRNKRLYSNTTDPYHGDNGYQPDPFNNNARPSPALAASAAAAADSIHGHNSNQWDQQHYSYGNMAPQTPMVAVAKQHDPYYTTGQMNYDPNTPGYYNNGQQQYYDPNAAYYEPQQQHYDQHYNDSQKLHYEPYSIPAHHSPVLNHSNTNIATSSVPATTGSNVYSSPNTYDDHRSPTNNNTYR